jgi:hypothetical protein
MRVHAEAFAAQLGIRHQHASSAENPADDSDRAENPVELAWNAACSG